MNVTGMMNRAARWLLALSVFALVSVRVSSRSWSEELPGSGTPDEAGSPELRWPWDDPRFEAPRIDNDDERELPIALSRLFVPRWRLAGGPQVKAAFRDVVDDAADATVCVHCDGRHVAYGGVVGSNGWIVTKATQLHGQITCILPGATPATDSPATATGDDGEHQQGAEHESLLAAVDPQLDLALLKIDATGLKTLDLSHEAEPGVGAWLATAGVGKDPVAVGIVSVRGRTVRPQPAVLGVELDEWAQPPRVVKVYGKSPAERAGIQAEDRIVSLDGVGIAMREQLIRTIRTHNPGDSVKLVVDRGGEKITIEASLGNNFPGFMRGRNEFQNRMGGQLSVRRFGWSEALQHDTALRPTDCGGPVVDLDGHVVGLNIARAGRTESYALPTSLVKQAIEKLEAQSMAASAAAANTR